MDRPAPLHGLSLASLALLWLAGRIAIAFSAWIGAIGASVLDLAFPAVFLFVVMREIVAGGELAKSADCRRARSALRRQSPHPFRIDCDRRDGAIGARLGVATLLLLVALIGGRITPSFTRNWLAKQRPDGAMPASFDFLDRAALAATALACAIWVAAPEGMLAPWLELVAAVTLGLRLARWRDQATLREPLLWVLHLGYGWLSFGFLLLALSGLNPALPQSAALHALTVARSAR